VPTAARCGRYRRRAERCDSGAGECSAHAATLLSQLLPARITYAGRTRPAHCCMRPPLKAAGQVALGPEGHCGGTAGWPPHNPHCCAPGLKQRAPPFSDTALGSGSVPAAVDDETPPNNVWGCKEAEVCEWLQGAQLPKNDTSVQRISPMSMGAAKWSDGPWSSATTWMCGSSPQGGRCRRSHSASISLNPTVRWHIKIPCFGIQHGSSPYQL